MADAAVRGGVNHEGGNDFRGIGLLEVAWRVLEAVLNWRFKEVVVNPNPCGLPDARVRERRRPPNGCHVYTTI